MCGGARGNSRPYRDSDGWVAKPTRLTQLRHRLWPNGNVNKPGGNATGIRIFSAGLIAKRLQLLHDLVPAATAVGFLMNPTNPTSATQVKEAETAAAAIGLQIRVAGASDEQDLNAAFETLAEHKVRALVVGADPFFTQRDQLIRLVARYRLPAVYEWRELAAIGGVKGYRPRPTHPLWRLGVYARPIVQGGKTPHQPRVQQTKVLH